MPNKKVDMNKYVILTSFRNDKQQFGVGCRDQWTTLTLLTGWHLPDHIPIEQLCSLRAD